MRKHYLLQNIHKFRAANGLEIR